MAGPVLAVATPCSRQADRLSRAAILASAGAPRRPQRRGGCYGTTISMI